MRFRKRIIIVSMLFLPLSIVIAWWQLNFNSLSAHAALIKIYLSRKDGYKLEQIRKILALTKEGRLNCSKDELDLINRRFVGPRFVVKECSSLLNGHLTVRFESYVAYAPIAKNDNGNRWSEGNSYKDMALLKRDWDGNIQTIFLDSFPEY